MKKQILLITGGIFILVSFLAIALFLIVTAPQESIDGDISLVGEWKVYEYENNAIEGETIIFDEDTVTDYRDNKLEPYFSDNYSLEKDTLKLEELDKEYYVKKISDYNLVLAETKEKLMKIFKVSDIELQKSDIIGDWEVIMHAGTKVDNEIVSFTENNLKDYRNNEKEPYLSSSYSWENENTIYVDGMKISFEIHKLENDYLILLEKGNQYVWELKKKN